MNGRLVAIIVFFAVVGLAGFQLISTAVLKPRELLMNLLTIAIVVGILYWLYKLFISSKSAPSSRSYDRAAKQSRRKYGKQNVTPLKSRKFSFDVKAKKASASSAKKKKKQTHLTVIEGKKGKKKDRASF